MKQWIFALFLTLGSPVALRAAPFERAEVTKAINIVSLLPRDTRAVPGDVVKGDTGLKTGGNSRAELQFPDLTITRVGSNALFRFLAGTRDIVLDSGTMLFSSPKGAGGGKVQAGAVTAAVTGSDFLISNAGRVKVISLNHKVLVYFTANPNIRTVLLPGQMLDIPAGAEKETPPEMPPVITINLKTLLATSMLGEAGGFGLLPSQAILTRNATRQERGFVSASGSSASGSLSANGSPIASAPLSSNGPVPANVNLAAQTAQTVRSTTVASNNNPPTQATGTVVLPGQTGNGTGATGGSSVDSGNRGNNANIANNQNRGNSGDRGNNANIANNQNRGNSGNAGNNANIANNQNRGNSGNAGNNANIANNQNRGNNGNAGNNANIANNQSRGNSGN